MQPAIGPVSQEFGTNPHFSWQPWGHLGRDYALNVGSGLTAIAPGVVLWADWSVNMPKHLADAWIQTFGSPASGICVIIQHNTNGRVHYTMYAHLDSTHLYHKTLFHKASVVKRGDSVGKSGNTGNSTGPHLHFECFQNPVWTAPFGRYDPRTEIATQDRIAAAQAAVVIPSTSPTQRRVIAGGVNELSAPSTKTGKVLRTFPGGEVLNFKGYVIGERVDGMNGWLVGAISGTYFHIGRFTQKDVKGLPNLTPIPGQRKSGGSAVANRATPHLGAEVVRWLPENVNYVFDAYCDDGDEYEGSRVWFRGKVNKDWSHSKLFTSQSTAGMVKVPAPDAGTRKSGEATVANRETPHHSARVDRWLPGNVEYVFDAYCDDGDEFAGTRIWFRGRENKDWSHSKLFTSQSLNGLTKVPAPPKATIPNPEPEPEPPYSFAKAVPCVTGVYPAAKNKFQRGGIPVIPPADLFLHQFMASTPEENPEMNRENVHISSVTNTFTEEDDRIASAHFGVEGREIRQYVDLADRAYHAGTVGNDSWGIEIYGMLDEESLASVALLITQLEDKFDRSFNLRKHNEVMATLCGRHIDLEYVRELVFDLQTPPLPPVVETPEELRDILVARVTLAIDNTLKEGQ